MTGRIPIQLIDYWEIGTDDVSELKGLIGSKLADDMYMVILDGRHEAVHKGDYIVRFKSGKITTMTREQFNALGAERL